MTNIDIVKVILSHIGTDPANDKALAQGCIVLLDAGEVKPATKKADPKPKASKPKGRKPFDTGKMKACLNAGRSISWVADEMGVSDQTIRNHMKNEGLL